MSSADSRGEAFSYQFQLHLIRILGLSSIVGMHPLLTSPFFHDSWMSWDNQVGWSTNENTAKSFLLILPTKLKPAHRGLLDQLQVVSEPKWAVLVPKGRKPPQVSGWLGGYAHKIWEIPKDALILHERGAWKRAVTKTRQGGRVWELWGPKAQPPGWDPPTLKRLRDFQGTALGTSPLPSLPPEELKYGQRAEWLRKAPESTVVATDGSLKSNGQMGAALVGFEPDPLEHFEPMEGDPNIVRAELQAILAAVLMSPKGRPLIILTDSATALRRLQNCKHTTFRKQQPLDQDQQTTMSVCEAINSRLHFGYPVSLLKVRSHTGCLLNERVDELANRGADASLVPPLSQGFELE